MIVSDDAAVSNRRFIPILGLSCLALVIVMRLYASSGDDRIATRVYAPPGAAAPPSSAQPRRIEAPVRAPRAAAMPTVRQDRRTGDDRRGSVPRRNQRSSVSWRLKAARLADRLDDAVVRWRNELDDRPETWLLRGWLAMQTGEPARALDCFDRILAGHADYTPALSAKAAMLVTLRRNEEASATYAQLIRLLPGDAAARYNYGVLLYRRALYSEAAEQFRELVRLQPGHARGQYNLATLAQREGRLSEARDAWRAFVRLEPNVASAWFNLGVVWMDYDEPAQAADCFHRAGTIAPEDGSTWLNLAIAYARAGHLQLALDAADQADELSSCDPTVMNCQAALHEMLAEQGGREAQRHRDQAAALREQIGRPSRLAGRDSDDTSDDRPAGD